MGSKCEKMPTFKWLAVEQATLDEHALPELEMFLAEADARKAYAMKRHTDPAEYDRVACTVLLDNVVRNPARLRAETGVEPRPYFYMVACVKNGLKGDLAGGGVDENRAGRQGNRCNILPAHMPFLLLHAARSGNPPEMLESRFGMDQTAISRHLGLAQALLTDPGTMPTITAVAGEIAATPGDEVVEAIGRVINCDVAEFEIAATPADRESIYDAFSGKAHTTTARAVFMCSQAGLFLAMGDIMEGRRHDMAALCDTLPFLGDIARSMDDPSTPEDRRMMVNLDEGMQGSDKKWPGADVRIPRKKAGGKELSGADREYNRSIGAPRSVIETGFRRIRAYPPVGGIFRGTIPGLGDMVVFLTGVVNLQQMMMTRGCADPKRLHRKGPPGERPKAGRAGRTPFKAPE